MGSTFVVGKTNACDNGNSAAAYFKLKHWVLEMSYPSRAVVLRKLICGAPIVATLQCHQHQQAPFPILRVAFSYSLFVINQFQYQLDRTSNQVVSFGVYVVSIGGCIFPNRAPHVVHAMCY